jgi:microcystin-dependent protein
MDRRERFESLEEALRVAFDGERANLWTALPGIIQSFDPVTQTCTVQPSIKALLTSPAGIRSWVLLPLLVDCPVYFPKGGGFSLTFPVSLGDEALVVFSSRSIDAWWSSGNVDIQSPLRMHDLSDGMVFVGFSSKPKVLSGIRTNAVQLRTDDGLTFVEMLLDGNITLSNEVGMLAAFGMGATPVGWLSCPTAQTLISTTSYARLFAKLGYTWGGIGGSFGIPYFMAGYSLLANAGLATLTHGAVISHTHQIGLTGYPLSPGSSNQAGWVTGASQLNTLATGGPDNLAAGMGVNWCVKY